MTEEFSELTKRLSQTVCSSRPETSLLLNDSDGEKFHTIPAVSKICSIISHHLLDEGNSSLKKSQSEQYIHNRTSTKANCSLPIGYPSCRLPDMSTGGDVGEISGEDDVQDPSSGQEEAYVKQYMAEHENQVALWKQMTSFRQEYNDMRSQVESALTGLSMDLSNKAREASCQFILMLAQMGCPSCSTGNSLEACSEHLKTLEGDLERARSENTSLSSRMEAVLKLKNQVESKLSDREVVISSLTETIDQLQSHCHQLEENSSDVPQWEELIASLERALRSIGRMLVDDSELYVDDTNEEGGGANNWTTLPLLAESTVTAVRAALARRRSEIQQLQSSVNESEERMLQSDQSRGDVESREKNYQKEMKELRIQLADVTREKQVQREGVAKAERSAQLARMELEEKENVIRQLQDELHREKSSRQRMEETLTELRHEEALQRSSHTELLHEFQQLSCDNHLCRTNIAAFEERLHRLRKELDQVREERTRLSVSLDFSKDERNLLSKQLKELEEKSSQLKDQSRNVQLEKMSVEDSLCRLQVLKSLDEAQLQKLNTEIEQLRNEGTLFIREKEELNGEVTALKHELVKAEELRMRLESFATTLEHSLGAANADNEEIKDQLGSLTEINEQLIEKQTAMDHRCAEIETANNHLMEEISKLTREFNNSKEREQSWREEVDRCRLKVLGLEEENRALHEQFLSAQNVNQLTQVSMVASQTSYSELQIELERVTKEMQELCVEREGLLIELQQLQESTNTAVALLQDENKNLARDMNELAKGLEEAAKERISLINTNEREKEDVENRWTVKWTDLQHEHQRVIESLRVQHGSQLAEQRKELETQIAKVREDMSRRDSERQQQIALLQVEKKSLQERVSAYTADLENERKEIARMRQEETERHLQHKEAIDDFRAEIARLHGELRATGDMRAKEMQTAEQMLAAAKENLKRTEHDFTASRTDLTTANRDLKEALRQVDSLQIQLSKMESQRDEACKESLQRAKLLEEVQSERIELRNSVVGLQSSIKRLESDREDVVKCLEEARKRIAVLEENRGVLEREIHHLRTLVKDGDQQVARLTEDLNISQQKLERSQDVQNRWKERSEALVEQLQAEQNRTILAEQTVTKYMTKIQAIKVHYQQLEQQYSQRLQQSDSQHSILQQRQDEMDLTVQKTIARSKRLEEERHNFHSRLLETDKEVNILKNQLREADSQSQDLTNQMRRLDAEKKELTSRFGVLYSTLKRFIRVLDDGEQQRTQNNSNISNRTAHESGPGMRFLQPLSSTLESEMSMVRDSSAADPDAIQIMLQDLMRHIMQLQARRAAETAVSVNEPCNTRMESSSRERQRQLVRQMRDSEGNVAGLREQLHQSLSTVASHVSLGPQTLHRESTRLDGLLVSGNRRFDASPSGRSDGQAP